MNENIFFPEDKIPEIVKLIRRGLKKEKDKDIIKNLENQCKKLEEYWRDLHE